MFRLENFTGHLPTPWDPHLVGNRAISRETVAFVMTIRLIKKGGSYEPLKTGDDL